MGFKNKEVACMRYDKEKIREATSIVELVSQYVTLKPRGNRWMGCCPFHSDHTPSFSVTENTRTFKCFGCGISGDVFTFLMTMEGLTFPQALESLAKGINFPAQQSPVLQRKLIIKP